MAKIIRKFMLFFIILHFKSSFCELILPENSTSDELVQGLSENSHVSAIYTTSCVDLAAAIACINTKKTNFRIANYPTLIAEITEHIIRPKRKDGTYTVQLTLSKIDEDRKKISDQDSLDASLNNSISFLISTSPLVNKNNEIYRAVRKDTIELEGKIVITDI